jgi:hypothetical protein
MKERPFCIKRRKLLIEEEKSALNYAQNGRPQNVKTSRSGQSSLNQRCKEDKKEEENFVGVTVGVKIYRYIYDPIG